MSSRRLLKAVAVAVSALGLAACGPHSTSGGAAPAPAPTSAAVVGSQDAPSGIPSPVVTVSASTPAGAAATDAPPGSGCTPNALPARHKIVQPVRRPTQDVMYAKATTYVCDPNDGHYEPTGAEAAYHFASTVKAQLATGAVESKTVVLGDLGTHIGDCLGGGSQVQPPLTCSAFPVYDITQDSAGRITEIKEVWHS